MAAALSRNNLLSVLVAFNATKQDYIEGICDSDPSKPRVDQYSN